MCSRGPRNEPRPRLSLHVLPARVPLRACREFDIAVVGGGPAGLAAALWAARYRRRVVVIDAGQHRNRWTDAAHGYLANDGVTPAEVIAAARKDLASYRE